MKVVKAANILYYYDGPQVIEARDTIDGHYIAVMVAPEEKHDRYLVAGVAPERLRQFRSGMLDLRTLLAESDTEEWFIGSAPAGPDQLMALQVQHTSLVHSELLPDGGFVLHDRPTDDLALNEARARNNLVLEVTTDPPEAIQGHRIRVNSLTGLLSHFQSMVAHAYRAAFRDLSATTRGNIDSEHAHLMDVVIPAAAGSFRVVLEASQEPDLFGIGELARALQRVDMLFEHTDNPQQSRITLKQHRGHLAGSYLRLLGFLLQHRMGLSYSWAQPTSVKVSFRSVSESQAQSLVEVLSQVSNLGSESVTLIGEFEKVNRGVGSWGLLTKDGVHSGRVKDGGPSLNGLRAGRRYKFVCVEEIEEVTGTGRESRTLYLNEFEPV